MFSSIRQTKMFFDENGQTAVPSDKTNRLVVIKQKEFDERIFELLEGTKTYRPITKSKQVAIEKQANKLMKNVLRNKPLRRKKKN